MKNKIIIAYERKQIELQIFGLTVGKNLVDYRKLAYAVALNKDIRQILEKYEFNLVDFQKFTDNYFTEL
jgi:hypothetical protein